jgi:hypothetical protein
MNHDQAWQKLPDLLEDRDDAALLAHVRDCPACQRQLFLLGRIDRMLRQDTPEIPRRSRRPRRTTILAAGAAITAAAAVAAALALLLTRPPQAVAYTLHTTTGQFVGQATIGKTDAHNASLTLAAHDLPTARGQVLVLWASDGAASIPVGRFMVDSDGDCHVRFNLPDNHAWHEFWVTHETGPIIARGPD